MFNKMFFFKSDDGKGGGAGGNAGGSGTGAGNGEVGNLQAEPSPNFDDFYKGLEESQRKVIDGHVSGLQSALKSEREEKKDLVSQLREATGKLEKGSEAEKKLSDLTLQAEQAVKRATFVEEAIRPEIGCANPKAAFALASAEDLFKKDGNPDWDAIKKSAPELFRKGGGRGNAGEGTGGEPPAKVSMNEWIRNAAGRK